MQSCSGKILQTYHIYFSHAYTISSYKLTSDQKYKKWRSARIGHLSKMNDNLMSKRVRQFLKEADRSDLAAIFIQTKKRCFTKELWGEMVGHSPCLGENISFSKNKRSSLIFDKLLQYKRIIPHIIPHTKKCTW